MAQRINECSPGCCLESRQQPDTQSRSYCHKAGARLCWNTADRIYTVTRGDEYLVTSTQLAVHIARDRPSLYYSLCVQHVVDWGLCIACCVLLLLMFSLYSSRLAVWTQTHSSNQAISKQMPTICCPLQVCGDITIQAWDLGLLPPELWRRWLGGRKGIWPVKNWVVECWLGYLSAVWGRLAYGPADATATHCLLLQ